MTTARPYSLGAFLERYPEAHPGPFDGAEVDYQRVSIDSRTLELGDLFIALRGERYDGHGFIEPALAKGAAAAVVEKRWLVEAQGSLPDPARLVVVNDTLHFLQELAAWHRRRFAVPLVGLTGSNGKTTTRSMLGAVLATRYAVHQTRGNFNNHIGLPLTLLGLTEATEMAVVEMGMNHPGEIARLTEIAGPTAGVITNIGRAHIEFFEDLEAIYAEKTALFRGLPETGPIFLNTDDPLLARYPRQTPVVTVGTHAGADVRGELVHLDALGRPMLRINDAVDVRLPVPGRHNVLNALLAAAVGLHYGVAIEAVGEALEQVQPEGHRMAVTERDGAIIVNDAYNANPDSMRAAVDYLVELPDPVRRRYLVLGDMLELGPFSEAEHRALGGYIASRPIERTFLYGPCGEMVLEGLVAEGAGDRGGLYGSHSEIAAELAPLLSPGTAVLVKGSRGMTMEKVLQTLNDQWSASNAHQ